MKHILKDKLMVLESLPILVCLLNFSDKKIIYCNKDKVSLEDKLTGKFFNEVFEVKEDINKIFKQVLDEKESMRLFVNYKRKIEYLLYISKYETSINNTDTIIMVTGIDISNLKKENYIDISKCKDKTLNIYSKIAGLNFLEGCILEVNNYDNYFSLAYISAYETNNTCNNSDSEMQEHIKELADIIKNSIRGTDMFATMDNMEFLMVFPKCKYEIMLNVLATIENKLEFINNANEPKFKFKINYAVKEVNKQNVSSAKDIIQSLKNMLI